MNLDRTGKVISSPSSSEDNCDKNNINGSDSDKIIIGQKMMMLQTSSSLPDMQPDEHGAKSSSSSSTLSSNANNQSTGSSSTGKHVVLALENYNQMNDVGDHQVNMKKIKLNIDPTSSSSSLNIDIIGDVVTESSSL